MNRATRIVSPASAGALTTVSAVKDALEVAGTETDSYLARRISGASAQIAASCGRLFGRQTVEDTFSYGPVVAYRPHREPEPVILSLPFVVELVSVTSGGVALDTAALTLDEAAGMLLNGQPGYGVYLWPAYPIVVTYTTGWALPGDPARDLPETIEDVCIDAVVEAYFARGRDPSIRDEVVEGAGRIRYVGESYLSRQIDPRLAPYVVRS